MQAEEHFVQLPQFSIGQASWSRRRLPAARLFVESLETRNLLSVNVLSLFRGQTGSAADEPPDTIAAAGPDVIVELVNGQQTNHTSVAYYDKNTGAKLFQQDLSIFFRPLGGVLSQGDVVVIYDELAGRFALGTLDFSLAGAGKSRFDFAVSIDSNPLDGFTLARYDMNDGVGGFDFADYPRIGYNADAYVVSFNMFPAGLPRDHVDTLAIDKNTLAGHRVMVPGGSANFTMAPASMHDSQPGDPMWFVESSSELGGNTIGIVEMTNVLSDTPSYAITQVAVPDYFGIPYVFGLQPFSANTINTDDARIFNSAMRFGQIVAAQSIVDSSNGATHVRWYQFDTTGNAPILVQTGNIDQGLGVNTYYPSIDINILGDLGMTFMESSTSEYMSMYVTGRKSNDPLNAMQPPVLAFAGQDVYQGGRAGDFSGTTVDPVDGVTFWSANEYKPHDAYWGTGIASFSIDSSVAPPGAAAPSASNLFFLSKEDLAELTPAVRSFTQAAFPTTTPSFTAPVLDPFFDRSNGQLREGTPVAWRALSRFANDNATASDFWESIRSTPGAR